MLRHVALLTLLLAVATTSTMGCAFGKSGMYAEEGRVFPADAVGRLEHGMKPEDVTLLLGAPLEVLKNGSGEVWRYYARMRQDENVYFLGILQRRPQYIWDTEAKITFRDGKVESIETSMNPILPRGTPKQEAR